MREHSVRLTPKGKNHVVHYSHLSKRYTVLVRCCCGSGHMATAADVNTARLQAVADHLLHANRGGRVSTKVAMLAGGVSNYWLAQAD